MSHVTPAVTFAAQDVAHCRRNCVGARYFSGNLLLRRKHQFRGKGPPPTSALYLKARLRPQCITYGIFLSSAPRLFVCNLAIWLCAISVAPGWTRRAPSLSQDRLRCLFYRREKVLFLAVGSTCGFGSLCPPYAEPDRPNQSRSPRGHFLASDLLMIYIAGPHR